MGAYAWYYNAGRGIYYWTESYSMSATQFANEVSDIIGRRITASDTSVAYRQADMDSVAARATSLYHI
jgi:hypothetical protein